MVFRQILVHEWRLIRAERTVSLLLAAIVILTAYGLWNGRSWVAFQKQTIGVALNEQQSRLSVVRQRLASMEHSDVPYDPNYFRDPRNARAVNSVFGYQWAILPPSPLAPLAIGQSDLYPYYTAVTASSRHTSAQFDELQNPVQLLAGRFDLAFVIVYLLPLLIFSISYNLLSEERENGTLGLVLAQPVTLRTVLLAKASLRAGWAISVSVVISAAAILCSGAGLSSSIVTAGLFWALIVIAYALFWLGLAVAVNSMGWGSATNALTLAGIWLVLVAVVPSVLNVAVSAIHPLPSRIALVEAAREAQNRSLTRIGKRAASLGSIDMDQRARSSLLQIMDAEAEVQPILQQFDDQLDKQQEKVRQWRFVSPAIMAQLALTEIAGTSGKRYREFVEATEAFRGRWRSFLGPIYPRRFTVADVDRIPRFTAPESYDWDRGMVAGAIALLFLAYAAYVVAAMRLMKE